MGYDSDTGRYYFRDAARNLYQGPEGAEFGDMIRGLVCFIGPDSIVLTLLAVNDAPIAIPDEVHDEDLEAAPTRVDGYQTLATDDVSLPNSSFM